MYLKTKRGRNALFCELLLVVVKTVALVEAIYTSAGINELLLTGEEWVALRADFNLDVLLGGGGLNDVAAGAGDGSGFVVRMDSFLCHF